MRDIGQVRISRELFLSAFGANLGAFESWVTDRLTSLLKEQGVPAGHEIFHSGEPPEFFYLMREGRVRMIGDHGFAWTLQGRHLFGMSDALAERPRTRTAAAASDLRLMKVRFDDWLELLDDSYELARASIMGLARSVARHEEKLWRGAGMRAAAPTRLIEVRAGRLNVIERMAILMDAPLLRRCGVQPLSDLAASSEELSLRPGETLFERHVPKDKMFLVVEGEVEASRVDPVLIWRAGTGEIVCGASALGEHALAWSAHASTATRALAFRIEDWFDLMEEHFDMVRSVLGALELQRDELLEKLAAREQATICAEAHPLRQ